ncbi:MAG: HAD-IIIA family hydrolase [Armatimonadetes bacterium]|nr:HAD-IIIA family hydrolase [Armatimonadota bacterium]
MWTESGWVLQPDELVLLPGAGTAVARLNQAGVLVCAVTNQSCIGRGLLDLRVLGAIHDRLRLLLEAEGARLDGIYTCPHRPDDGCACRKPRPGLLLQAAARHRVDFSRAVVVGDNLTDIEAGRRTGCRTILVRTGDGATSLAALPAWAHQPDHLAADLPAAVDWILARCASS